MIEAIDDALRAAAGALLAEDHPGSWPNPRRPAISGAAGAVLALHTADRQRSAGLVAEGVAWLLAEQHEDGGWGTLQGLPSDFVATAMATAALHVAAPERAAEAVRRGRAWLADRGGVDGLDDAVMAQLTGLVLSVAGLHDADRVPRVPVEVLLLPAPLRRRLLSYLTPPFAALTFLQSRQRGHGRAARLLDRSARRALLPLLAAFHEQEGSVGSYGGDPWLSGLLCTALSRAGAAPELVDSSVRYLRMTAQPGGGWHLVHGVRRDRVEVTGMAFSVHALQRAGCGDRPGVLRARDWLRDCQQREPSEVYRSPAGAWTWTGRTGWPNGLETVLVLRVLANGPRDAESRRALRLGSAWLLAQQDRRGSWSTFVRDTLVPLDGPCPFITALAVELLHTGGLPLRHPRLRRALRWLRRHQAADGSFDARWHRGGVPATAAVAQSLTRVGLGADPIVRRARDWLLAAQLPDGSWSSGRGDPVGTPDETGHAVSALVACGQRAAAARGVRWLLAAQGADGRWEPGQTCVYVRDHVHYSDPLIAQGLATGALAAYRGSEA
ncbi:prenyltransferase/squalene oxidase repeat-containing protein [Saccharopolyspora cebuensis]|uniref:Prenyltransferase/squalene oxidase repeat-containing protein n=1 Tax=Saccharopolyspora cebuensis TaxID=418759 RepID=A0ABV4CC93_9PSEU